MVEVTFPFVLVLLGHRAEWFYSALDSYCDMRAFL